jgi:hypothetical protein
VKKIKCFTWIGALGIIIIFFQILRGDRDSAALVAATAMLHATAPIWRESFNRQIKLSRQRLRKLIIPLLVVVLIFVALGAARSTFSDFEGLQASPSKLLESGFNQTTWTAVLWTNLSAAYLYRSGNVHYKYGSTYRDYALSIIPGIISKLIGVERPIEAWKGPAWELGKSIPTGGGIHAAIVPFMNFGILGTFVILMLYGYMIGRAEMLGQIPRLWPRLIWVGFLLSSFRWFWYGDMIFIRALMGMVLAGIIYEFCRQFIRFTIPAEPGS